MVDYGGETAISRPDGGDDDKPRGFAFEDYSGKEIAGCRIVRKLGQGAMGAVYLAEQLSLRRTVAFKILDPKFSRDVTYIERFEREAMAAARLMHYNIVQVFDYGHKGDTYYIVTEYVDGGTVQDRIDAAGALEPAVAVDIALQSCHGLAVAQENQVIHRDIKPENLMLTKEGVVKVADFGLAKVVADDAAVTQSGMIVGTPFYMSPEQAKGLELDARSDIYSLGVTFFHMVTGQIPFDADSVIGVLLKQISAERPDPTAVNPSVPNAVGQVILRMMAREPKERFQSARELASVLESLKARIKDGTIDQAPATKPTGSRADRYKLLPESRIMYLRLKAASVAVEDRMRELLKADTGVFLETAESYPENSLVEVRFTVPGKAEIFAALGMVRWVSSDRARPGMGVTFLKVSGLSRAAVSGESTRRTVAPATREHALETLRAPDAIKLLTKSPLHQRLLRYMYANSGQSVEPGQVASALGVGVRMLAEPLAALERCGLMRRHSSGLIDLLWPEDEALQREIVSWVSKYGLR